MKLILLTVVIVFSVSNSSMGLDSPFEEHSFNVNYGFYFDNIKDLNKYFELNKLPEINKNYGEFISLNYSTNECPFLFDQPNHIFYSFSFLLPLPRYFTDNNYNNNLYTYSLFLETFIFESYLKKITIKPIVGIGFSQTNLVIRKTNSTLNELKNLDMETNSAFRFTKFTALLNLGGGGAFRFKLIDDAFKTKNLIFGFDVRYSISLDVFHLYNDKWKLDKTNVDLPNYYAPELSIEFYVGVEVLKKKYWE